MLKVRYSSHFKKDFKLIQKRGYNIDKLKETIKILTKEGRLPAKYKEHYLVGNYKRI